MNLEPKKEVASFFSHLLERFLLAVFVISGVLLTVGYQFPTSNHTIEVPPILSMLDSSLFPKDYFVQQILQFTPRTYHNYLIYLLASAGLGVPLSYFIVYAVALTSFVFGLQAIARNVCQSRISAVLLSFWGLTVFAGNIGSADLFHNTPLPSAYAMGLAIWGIYFSLRRAWPIAYAFFGTACLLQFLVGLLPALLVTPLLILDTWRTRQWFRAVLALSLLAIGAGLIYIPMLMQGTTSTDLFTNREFVELYGFIRVPHHIVPSAWNPTEWVQLILFYTGGIICLRKTRFLSSACRFGLIVVVGTMFFGLLVNFLFVEVFPLATVAKLQFARMTPFAELAILIGLTVLFDEHIRQRNWAVCVPLAVIPVSDHPGLLLLLFALGLEAFARLSPHLRAKSDLWIAALVVVSLYRFPITPLNSSTFLDFISAMLKGPVLFGILLVPHLLIQWLRRERTRIGVAFTLAVVAAGTLLAGISGLLPGRLQPLFAKRVVALNRVGDDEVSKLAIHFRQMSPKEAVVLVPPLVENFYLLSQRSIVVNFKIFPFTDRGFLEWKNRMEAVLGIPIQQVSWSKALNDVYSSQPSSALLKVAQRYGAGYILTRQDWHPDIPGKEVAREGAWVIWKIPNSINTLD